MASPVNHSRNNLPPSIRTLSEASTVIQSSLSPTSTLASSSSSGPAGLGIYSTASSPTSSTAGPAERNFFGALVQKARDRSRSRSRTRVHRSRSRSPLPSQTTQHHYYNPQMATRQAHYYSPAPQPVRVEPRRLESRSSTSSSEDFYYGRHANQWLFGNFSVRDTVRDMCSRSSTDKQRK